jgi:hypothetical protein
MVDVDAIRPRDVIRDFPIVFDEGTGSKNRPIVVVVIIEDRDELSIFPVYTRNNFNREYRCEIVDWEKQPDGSGAGLDHLSYVDVSKTLTFARRDLIGLELCVTGFLSDRDWANVMSRYAAWDTEQSATE